MCFRPWALFGCLSFVSHSLSFPSTFFLFCHHQRHPLFQNFRIFTEFHFTELVMSTHLLMTLTQESNVSIAPYEAHMRGRVDEIGWFREGAFFDHMTPQL